MSTYELNDELVQALLKGTDAEKIGAQAVLLDQLEKQRPVPVPAKIGAVVRTGKDVFVRVYPDNTEIMEWVQAGGPVLDSPEWASTHKIGQITQVLSEGVDL